MDIPPPSATTPYSPPPAHTTTASSSSDCPEWYHDLSQCMNTLNLDLQALSREQDHWFGVLESQQAEILWILRS